MRLSEISTGLPSGVKAPPPISYPVASSPFTAPGWREIDVAYSCIPDPVYPWDPVVMKAILEFAPDAVPMWVHWVFLSPQETGNPEVVVFGRHALGRRIQNKTSELEPFRCAMPTMPCQGLTFERPNRIWFIHEGSTHPKNPDLPGAFLPFDGSILDRAKKSATGFRMTEKEFIESMKKDFIEKERAATELRKKQVQDDIEYRSRDFEAYARRQLDKVSDVEAKEYVEARNRGLLKEEPKVSIVVP